MGKNYKAQCSASLAPADLWNNDPKVPLPRNPTTYREIDHTKYLGSGFDAWAFQSASVLRLLLASGSYSISTLVNYSAYGFGMFYLFLCSGLIKNAPEAPNKLTRMHLKRFISWLKIKYPNGSSAKNHYASLKGLITALADYGLIKKDLDRIFPESPFPNNQRRIQAATALSFGEMQRLMQALKADLIAIHKNAFTGNSAEAMTVLLLITAARSGINTTPLLEMNRDALAPHPFVPNLKILNTVKRRGKGVQLKVFRETNLIDVYSSIPLDGVAVLNKAIEMSKPLLGLASEEIRPYVWLYRSGQPGRKDHITTLANETIYRSAKRICARHSLKDDDGRPLRVSLSRLRKTMESRLWQLSGGDIVEVASVMNHSPAIADNHYLKMTEDLKLNGAKFVGEIFTDQLRGIDAVPTPQGKCKDTLYGDWAPKDGVSHCSDFIHCLSCSSYAVAGTVEDLYRLFSYQEFLKVEAEYYLTDEWASWREVRFKHIEFISEFTSKNFAASIVEKAKVKAEITPHAFWATKIKFLKKKHDALL